MLAFDQTGFALTALLGVGYGCGVLAVRRTPHLWPWNRLFWWSLGLVIIAAVTLGWIGRYAHVLFWAYTVQLNALLIIVPVCLALGRPVDLYRLARQRPALIEQPWILQRGVARAVLHPNIAPLFIPLALAAIYFTPLLEQSLRHEVIYQAGHVVVLGAGLLFAFPLVMARRNETSAAVVLAVALGVIELLLDGVPGFAIRFSNTLLAAPYYHGVVRSWGPSHLNDQHLGGALMWGLGDSADLPFIAILMWRWLKADEREAVAQDAPIGPVAQPSCEAAAATSPRPESAPSAPWWETDLDSYSARRATLQRRQAQLAKEQGRAREH